MDTIEQCQKRAIDLAARSSTRGCYTYSAFLSLAEQDAVLRALEKEHVQEWHFEGGCASAMRKIAVFGSPETLGYAEEAPITVLQIVPHSERFAENLTHRDYLGALMSLGIDRSTTGDFLIREKQAWLFCLNQSADFIMRNLTDIRHTAVSCRCPEGEIPEILPRFESLHLNVASARVDAIVSAVMGSARTKAQALIREERIFVNGRCVKSAAQELKDGTEVTVRGFGKFIYDGVQGRTRKDRLNVRVRKYV